MLFQRSCNIAQQRPDPNHLVECISSATSIIAIFDLFCRTFGDDYCILSLSYSVYTAASIFLLQVQAATGPVAGEEMTVRRLEFCIKALERVGRINPGEFFCVRNTSFDILPRCLEHSTPLSNMKTSHRQFPEPHHSSII